jgi:hypothetical protein
LRSRLASVALRTSNGSWRSHTIELEQIEGKQEHGPVLVPVAQPVECRQAIITVGHCLAIDQA